MIASLNTPERRAFLDELSRNAQAALPWLWELWAHPQHQIEPEGDWQTWVILGGRGAGKTRAGAEWIRKQVEGARPLSPGKCRRVALIGETLDQVRAVMVEGDSGLLATAPPDRRPVLTLSKNLLTWPNGAEAMLLSAANPEALRGPQFDGAWADELAKWRKCRDAWDMLQFCLRLGERPRQIVTTTPRDNEVLLEILDNPATVVTRAGTGVNQANLAPDFLARMRARFGATSLARQELDGEVILTREGALWTPAMIDAALGQDTPELDRIVVAVDPPVSGKETSDECGIVVAGAAQRGEPHEWTFHILADRSVAGKSPRDWARDAADAYRDFAADRLVAEVNQGGDLVETLIRSEDPAVSYRAVRATKGKLVRAEPIAALYEQGRVFHAGHFPELEAQMRRFGARSRTGIKSPDRLDALVWALTELSQIDIRNPRIRPL